MRGDHITAHPLAAAHANVADVQGVRACIGTRIGFGRGGVRGGGHVGVDTQIGRAAVEHGMRGPLGAAGAAGVAGAAGAAGAAGNGRARADGAADDAADGAADDAAAHHRECPCITHARSGTPLLLPIARTKRRRAAANATGPTDSRVQHVRSAARARRAAGLAGRCRQRRPRRRELTFISRPASLGATWHRRW